MRLLVAALAAALATHAAAQGAAPTLVERLGFPRGTRVLLINADDGGLAHAENVATIEALKGPLVGSATVMAPAPWFVELATFARANPQLDFGVHLTFTSEWEGFRYGPVLGRSAVPSLVDGAGYLHASVAAFHATASLAEVEAEGRAQIRRAIDAGFDVSHLDMHMHALGLDARFFPVYLALAREFDVPVRFVPPSEALRRSQAAQLGAAGILFQDYVIVGADQAPGELLPAYWRRKLSQLAPGVVTELYIHVAADEPELHALLGDLPFRTGWRDRVDEYRIFTVDPELLRIVEATGTKLVRWKDVRTLQRRERAAAAARR